MSECRDRPAIITGARPCRSPSFRNHNGESSFTPIAYRRQRDVCFWHKADMRVAPASTAEFSIKMCNDMKPLECLLLDLHGSKRCDGTLNQSAGQPKRDFAKRPRKSVVTVQ